MSILTYTRWPGGLGAASLQCTQLATDNVPSTYLVILCLVRAMFITVYLGRGCWMYATKLHNVISYFLRSPNQQRTPVNLFEQCKVFLNHSHRSEFPGPVPDVFNFRLNLQNITQNTWTAQLVTCSQMVHLLSTLCLQMRPLMLFN